MCTRINLKGLLGITKDKPLEPAPTIAPKVEQDSTLPVAKETIDPEKTATVAYGSQKKKPTAASAKKTGSSELKIPFNVGNAAGAKTGGLGGTNA